MQDILTVEARVAAAVQTLQAEVQAELSPADRQILERELPFAARPSTAFVRFMEQDHKLWYLLFRFERLQRSPTMIQLDHPGNMRTVFQSPILLTLDQAQETEVNDCLARLTQEKLSIRARDGDPTVMVDADRIQALEQGMIEECLAEAERRAPGLSDLLREKLGN